MGLMDIRLAKTYADSADPSFLADTFYLKLRNRGEDGASETCRHIRDIFLYTLDKFPGEDVTRKMGAAVAAALQAPDTPFTVSCAVAKLMGCSQDEEGEPICDAALLQKAINEALGKEFADVAKAKEEAKQDATALTFTALRDVEGLTKLLADYNESLNEYVAPSKKETPPSANRRPTSSRSSFGFFGRFRNRSAADESTQETEDATNKASEDANDHSKHPLLLKDEERRCTALVYAARLKYNDCLKAMCDAAAQAPVDVRKKIVESRDHLGRTASYMAVRARNFEAIKMLVEIGGEDLQAATIEESGIWTSPLEFSIEMAAEYPIEGLPLSLQILDLLGDKLDVGRKYNGRRPKSQRPSTADESADAATEETGDQDEEQEQERDLDNDLDEEEDEDEDELGEFGDAAFERIMRRMYGRGMLYDTKEYVIVDKAAYQGSLDIVEIFLKRGAEPSDSALHDVITRFFPDYARDGTGDLQSLSASDLNLYACMKALVAAKPSLVNSKDEEGNTPMHVAAERGNLVVIKFLQKNKADPRARNEDNKMPADLAEGYPEIVDYLSRSRLLTRLMSKPSSRSGETVAEEELPEVPEEEQCVICREREKQVVLAPCGHRITCKRCTRILLDGPQERCRCPFCSEHIDSFILKVFE